MKKTTISISIDEQLKNAIDAVADRTGIKRSTIISRALADVFEEVKGDGKAEERN